MKLLVLDGKKLGVVVVAMGLMIILFGLGVNLDNRIRATAFIQSNMGELKKYRIEGYKISYKLPLKWSTKEQKFANSEIVYHNNFEALDSGVHGYIEVWTLKDSLKDFLDKSKVVSENQNEVSDYKISSIAINNKSGYLVTYKIQSANQLFSAYEYFVVENGNFVRFSFYVAKDKFEENMPLVFKAIVETLSKE